MTDTPPEQAWFDKAAEDLEIARRALGPDRPFPAAACFHAQQCAEKYLKGYLVAHDVPFRFVHDLGYLIGLCAGVNPALASLRPAAITLNPYVAIARYPSEAAQEPDIEAAEKAIAVAEQIAAAVARK
ncbi:MAG: HEPN domain-containing protein [Chloroflexota bacterium]|nr:HEPN domain-containing protein [Chloroflexota bacterium]